MSETKDFNKEDMIQIITFYKNKLSDVEFAYLELQVQQKKILEAKEKEFKELLEIKEQQYQVNYANFKEVIDELKNVKKKKVVKREVKTKGK